MLYATTVAIEYEELPPTFDPEKATTVFKHIDIRKGDVEKALGKADLIIEGTYRTGAQEHVYIEPNGVIAVPEEGGVAVYGSIQCPFYVLKALRSLLGNRNLGSTFVDCISGPGSAVFAAGAWDA